MPRDIVAIVGFLVGLALLASAGYYGLTNDITHYGQPQYAITEVTELSESSLPADAEVLSYESLPRDGRRAFDAAREGESYLLWEREDSQAIGLLIDHSYIRYRGTYYDYLLLTGHKGTWGEILGTTLLLGGAGLGLSAVAGSRMIKTSD